MDAWMPGWLDSQQVQAASTHSSWPVVPKVEMVATHRGNTSREHIERCLPCGLQVLQAPPPIPPPATLLTANQRASTHLSQIKLAVQSGMHGRDEMQPQGVVEAQRGGHCTDGQQRKPQE